MLRATISHQRSSGLATNHGLALWHYWRASIVQHVGIALATALLHSSNSENDALILQSHAPSKGKTFKAPWDKNTATDLFPSVLTATQKFSFASTKMHHAAGLFTLVEYLYNDGDNLALFPSTAIFVVLCVVPNSILSYMYYVRFYVCAAGTYPL